MLKFNLDTNSELSNGVALFNKIINRLVLHK